MTTFREQGIGGVMAISSGQHLLLDLWRLRCMRAAKGHHGSSALFHALDTLLTTLNIVFAISVSVLSYAQWVEPDYLTYITIAGVGTVILTVLRLYFDYRTRWRAHQ